MAQHLMAMGVNVSQPMPANSLVTQAKGKRKEIEIETKMKIERMRIKEMRYKAVLEKGKPASRVPFAAFVL